MICNLGDPMSLRHPVGETAFESCSWGEFRGNCSWGVQLMGETSVEGVCSWGGNCRESWSKEPPPSKQELPGVSFQRTPRFLFDDMFLYWKARGLRETLVLQPVPEKINSKWSSKCKTKSNSESRNYHSRSLFKIPIEKRPGTAVSWFRFRFRFAFRWLVRVPSSRDWAVLNAETDSVIQGGEDS